MSKKLGQNFLISQEKIKRIVDSLEIKDGDTIVEIGPGKGALTMEILKYNVRFIGIEKDVGLAKNLESRIKNLRNSATVVAGDVLKVLPEISARYLTPDTKYKLIGNIPFYLTGYLLRTIGELEHRPELTVLVVQREVAERLAAKPPRMNLLAASVQFWALPEILGNIPRQNFKPQPEVDAAIVSLKIVNYESGIKDNYYELIKILFRHPRKMILNNLLTGNVDKKMLIAILKRAGINPGGRPQTLGIENIKKLSHLLHED